MSASSLRLGTKPAELAAAEGFNCGIAEAGTACTFGGGTGTGIPGAGDQIVAPAGVCSKRVCCLATGNGGNDEAGGNGASSGGGGGGALTTSCGYALMGGGGGGDC